MWVTKGKDPAAKTGQQQLGQLPLPPLRACISHKSTLATMTYHPHLLPNSSPARTPLDFELLKRGDFGPSLDSGSCCPVSLEHSFLRPHTTGFFVLVQVSARMPSLSTQKTTYL